ncbi:MAG: PPC domain-containing protein [Chloroflexi bacterium]|nr:PPC domain-containing protein [Chloroflexota bacterium]
MSVASHLGRRRFVRLLLCLLLGGVSAVAVLAQGGSQILVPGTTLSVALGSDTGAVAYVFDGAANTTASISLENIDGAALALHISDISGNMVAQSGAAEEAGASVAVDALLSSGGRYFVFIYTAPGSDLQATTFDLAFDLAAGDAGAEVVAAPAVADQILLGAGIEVRLTWTGAADLDLEVRDPVGQTLFWNSRSTENGGSFGFDANGLCDIISADPLETATWQPGFLPTGSYEVIVYYEQACDALTASVPFQVDVIVDGESSGTIEDVLSPGVLGQQNVYVGRFVLGADAVAEVVPGGLYPASSITRLPSSYNFAADIPTPIAQDVTVLGEITNAQPFVTYSFEGVANELISVDMQALSDSLDTLVQIVDPNGAVVDVNDDSAIGGTTNSFVADTRLLSSGTYRIIATRYAKEAGGTVGQFQLTLTGATGGASVAVSQPDLPQGDVEVGLFWSSSADLQLLVRDPLGESVFDDNPAATTGGILQEVGNANCVAASGAPVSYIYWPDGFLRAGTYEVEVWYQDPCADFAAPVNFTLQIEVDGVVIARLRQFPQPGQRFVTNFTVQPSGLAIAGEAGFIDAGSGTLAYQDEALSAPVIESGVPVRGTISPSNTFDVYQFDGATGEAVNLSLSGVTLVLDTNLYLIGPSGRELATNDDGDPIELGLTGRTTDSRISGFVLPENGPYTVIATRYGNQYGGTIGIYELVMTKI